MSNNKLTIEYCAGMACVWGVFTCNRGLVWDVFKECDKWMI
jgi:hypothetical protein